MGHIYIEDSSLVSEHRMVSAGPGGVVRSTERGCNMQSMMLSGVPY